MPSPEAIKTTKLIYSFIAYVQTPESVRDPRPNAGDTPLTIRPQTFVRFAPAIKVKAITQNSTGKSVAVTFDAASVGYTKDLVAHLVNSDPGVALLQAALDEQRPVAVGIEAHRKNMANNKALSRIVPIHALRGADEKGRKANSNTTGTNIGANVIAYVDGHTTAECASDPEEWAELCESNTTGLVAPRGWRVVTSPEWGEYAFIAQDDTAGGAGNLDEAALAAVMEKVVYDALVRFNDESSNNIAHAQNGVPTEGTPWNVRTSDGRMSLGNYSQSRYADLLGWWTATLRKHPKWSGRGVGPVQPLAQIYAQRTFTLLNQVVTEAYGQDGLAPWPADPAKEGWRTAWRHLTIALNDAIAEAQENADNADESDLMVFVTDTNAQGDLDEAAWGEWAQFWGTETTRSLRHATAILDDFYSQEWQQQRNASRKVANQIKTDREKSQRERVNAAKAKAKGTGASAAPQEQPAAQQPQQDSSNPGDESIRASLYAAVQKHWNDAQRLGNVKAQMAEKNFLELRVSAQVDGSELVFLTDPQKNCKVDYLVKLLDWRIGKLNEAASRQANTANAPADNTLGVAVPAANRVDEIKNLIDNTNDPDELRDLTELINAEGIGDADIMIGEAPSSLGVYVRFRLQQVAKAS